MTLNGANEVLGRVVEPLRSLRFAIDPKHSIQNHGNSIQKDWHPFALPKNRNHFTSGK